MTVAMSFRKGGGCLQIIGELFKHALQWSYKMHQKIRQGWQLRSEQKEDFRNKSINVSKGHERSQLCTKLEKTKPKQGKTRHMVQFLRNDLLKL